MTDDEDGVAHRPVRSRADPADAHLARALGALLGLPSPAASAPASAPAHATIAWTAPPSSSEAGLLPVSASAWTPAPPPSPTVDDSFWGASPVDIDAGESDSRVADEAAALLESGFGGPMHTALGELRRISGAGVPVRPTDGGANGGGRPDSGGGDHDLDADVPDWYTEPPLSTGALPPAGSPGAWLAMLADWWGPRRRELLPGMAVAALIILAFAVVLISGTRQADTSHVGTRPVPLDSNTTVPGLFATAGGVSPIDAPAPGSLPSGSDASLGGDQTPSVGLVTTTTEPKSGGPAPPPPAAGPSKPQSPAPTSPPATSPPATSPPATSPPATSPPPTSPPPTDPPPTSPPTTDPPVDICEIRPTRC